MLPVHAGLAVGSDACCPPSGNQGAEASPSAVFGNYAAQVAIVKEMTGRNRAAQLEFVKQMSRQ